MKITGEMEHAAAMVLNTRLASGVGLHGVSRDMLTAALSAAPGPQCCMCGKTDLSTKEGDGGTECELNDGRWVCSAECWDEAVGSAAPAVGVEVKPLEWHPIMSPREDGLPEETGDIEADTMIGEYSVCFDEDEAVSDTHWCCWSQIECIGHFAGIEEAKAAAQSDYEDRIMSALVMEGKDNG